MFDTFVNKDDSEQVQLKVGPCILNTYYEGECTEVSDGVYIAPDGVGVIRHGRVEQVTQDRNSVDVNGLPIFSKWGDKLESIDEDVSL